METLPIKLEDIFSFNVNFDNLIKIIKFLHTNNLTLSKEIKDMHRRISVIDDWKTTISDLEIKSKSYETNILEINSTISSFSTKFMDIESKVNDLTQKNLEINSKVFQFDNTWNSHEDNLNNINRVLEDHIKTYKENNRKNDEVQAQVQEIALKLGSVEEETKANKKTSENEMVTVLSKIEKNENEIKALDENCEKKNGEIDKTISNLITTISDMNTKINTNQAKRANSPNQNSYQTARDKQGESMPIIHTVEIGPVASASGSDNNWIRLAISEIEKMKTKFEGHIKESNEYKEVTNKINKNNETCIAAIQRKLDELNPNVTRTTNQVPSNAQDAVNSEPVTQKTSSTNVQRTTPSTNESKIGITINESIINEIFASGPFKKINDNVRIISNSIGNKVNKEELSEIGEQLIKKIAKLDDKWNEKMSFYDQKITNLKTGGDNQSQGSNMQNFDFDFFTQNLETQITEQIRALSRDIFWKEIATSDLTVNPSFIEILNRLRQHKEELDQTYKSIVDIRSSLVSNELLNDIQELKTRIEYNELEGRGSRQRIETIMQMLEGDEGEESQSNPMNALSGLQEQPHQFGTIKDKWNVWMSSNQSFDSRITALEQVSSKLAAKIREDLNTLLKKEITETNKAFNSNLENMKIMLKDSIQAGLKTPLNDWEEKMKSTFNSKINNKLDKKEWSTNNCKINRKIDYLENKISKTLVDTIIDLQMDEAPLVVKKNAKNVEKCASCNQNLPPNNWYYSMDKFKNSKYNNMGNSWSRLPNINEK